MKPVDVIRKLQAAPGRLDKQKIVSDAWDAGCVEFFAGVQLAYDPMTTFGVKKVPEITDFDETAESVFESTFGWKEFKALADQLANRKLTGHAARDALNVAAKSANVADWNEWYRRILLRDLRAGFSESTVNKVLKKKTADARRYLVTKFECQLAKSVEPDAIEGYGKRYLDQKLDGVRIITIMDTDKGTVTQYTRNGKINENFTYIIEALEKMLPDLPGSLVLDGEMVSRSFQELMTQVNRKKGVDTQDARLALFDVLPLEEFRAGKSKATQTERVKAMDVLQGMFQEHTEGRVFVLPKLLVDLSTDEGRKKFRAYNKETLEAGYEGVMVKDPDAVYECKRSKGWLKLKPVITVDLTVVDIEEGTGKNLDSMGALVCEGVDDGKKIRVNVGSGYSDDLRTEIWGKQSEVIGQVVEVMADVITKDRSDDDVYSLRFPRFVRFRGMEKGEKI